MNSDAGTSSATSPAGPPRSPSDQLFFRQRHREGVRILSVHGEADAFTLPLWRHRVREAADLAATENGALIVDATRLRFLSLRTLAVLAEEAQRCRRDGVVLCLVTTELRVAAIAAGDARATHLLVRSTVDSALTAIRFQQHRTPSAARRPFYRVPEITPDGASAGHSGRMHYRAGETIPGHDGLPGAVATTAMPGAR